MARPEKDEADRRGERIQIRLTAAEAEAVREAAERARRTPSDYVRTLVLDALDK